MGSIPSKSGPYMEVWFAQNIIDSKAPTNQTSGKLPPGSSQASGMEHTERTICKRDHSRRMLERVGGGVNSK